VTIGIEEPRVVNVIEGVNLTVEYCVVITEPSMGTTIERDDCFVCVSTVDGTAVGKNIGRRGMPAIHHSQQSDTPMQRVEHIGVLFYHKK